MSNDSIERSGKLYAVSSATVDDVFIHYVPSYGFYLMPDFFREITRIVAS